MAGAGVTVKVVKSFPWGALVRVTAQFSTHEAPCDAVDPDDVDFTVLDPEEGIQDESYDGGNGAVVRDSTGAYHFDVNCTIPGKWQYRWSGTGDAAAVAEGSFNVNESDFRPPPT